MLVLSRKAGQRIVIGEKITIYISRIAGHRVTLGLDAPRGVRIRRGELKPQEDPSGDPPIVKTEITLDRPIDIPPTT